MNASIVRVAAALLILPAAAAAAQSERFPPDLWREGRVALSGDRELPYRLLLPPPGAASQPDPRTPLVILLHADGGSGTDNRARGIHSFDVLASHSVRSDYPAYLLTPQLPSGLRWHTTGADPLAAVLEITREVIRDHDVDPRRVYLVGEGAGAEAVRLLAVRAPRRFAALVLLSGVERPAGAQELAALPVWIFHGAEDDVYPVAAARGLVSALWAADAPSVRYTEYPGVAHRSWRQAWEEPRLLPWLFSQSRE